MEKENKPKAKGKAKKVVANKEKSITIDEQGINAAIVKGATEAKQLKGSIVKPKQQAKTRLVQCVVVNRFYDSKQNKEYGINQLWEGTLERIEEINNKIHQGRRLNALKIVKSKNE